MSTSHETPCILHIVKCLCSRIIKRDVAVWAVICLMSLQSVWHMLLTLIFLRITEITSKYFLWHLKLCSFWTTFIV